MAALQHRDLERVILDFSIEEAKHPLAKRAAIGFVQELADRIDREIQCAQTDHDSSPLGSFSGEHTIATIGAFGLGDEADFFVVTERFRRNAQSLRKLADLNGAARVRSLVPRRAHHPQHDQTRIEQNRR